ncbi:hypothetical protein ANCDUO_09439 [Ancylostoma duodenale]|uniref:Peptidase M13 N-terminal domain-containing protein n=1 Tax=Ancylostoma duodenale TaxID=51022 RepID=A0A0C2DD15_9BILA|nr:hypothetical protein ANCDUO_09439 [Ancylostoma duodenale]
MFESKSVNNLKTIYKRCMDKDERVAAKHLLDNIRSYGVWPMLDGDDKWRIEDFDLTSLLAHVSEVRSLNVFITIQVYFDLKNVSRYIILVSKAA